MKPAQLFAAAALATLIAAAPSGAVGADPVKRHDIPLEGSPALGPPDAPVTVVEFLDFQ